MFSLLQRVEVLDNSGTSAGSWLPAVVKCLDASVGSFGVEFLQDTSVREAPGSLNRVPSDQLRPAPPEELSRFKSIGEVKVGHSVEVFQQGRWRPGLVQMVRGTAAHVKLLNGTEEAVVGDPQLLRPRVELLNGQWHRVLPPSAELLGAGIWPTAVEAAMQVRHGDPGGTAPMDANGQDAADGDYEGNDEGQEGPEGRNELQGGDEGDEEQEELAAPGLRSIRQGGRDEESNDAMVGDNGRDSLGRAAEETEDGSSDEDNGPSDGGADTDGNGEDHEERRAPRQGGRKRQRAAMEDDDTAVGGEEELGQKEQEEEEAEQTAAPKAKRPKRGSGGVAALPSRPRRTGQQRVIYINKFPVLKANMYSIHDLDTMVWQRAVKNGEADMKGVVYAPPPKPTKPSKAKPTQPKADAMVPSEAPPSQPAQLLAARVEHNNRIRADIKERELVRARYLLEHVDRLRPFITPQVEAHLRKVGVSPLSPSKRPPRVSEQPDQILAVLREYQLEGLAWLVAQFERGVNAILADEMGLGKTLQTITFLAHLKFRLGVEGPHLVVVPLSVLTNWTSEFKRWCPEMRVVRLHANDEDERKRLIKEVLGDPDNFDVAVTTYEMIKSRTFGPSLKHNLVWRCLVLDEAHRVKNEEAAVSVHARHIARQHVLMLTGTPIQNNLLELFALLNFMYPDVFTDSSRFDDAFNLAGNKVDRQRLDSAHYLLRPFMLRRRKDEVEVRLPPMLETRIHCPLVEMQTFWYRRLLLRNIRELQDMAQKEPGAGEKQEAGSWKKALNLLMQLRKVCNHPFMFPDAEPDFDGETAPEELVTGSGKMMVLDRLLSKLKAKGHRVVLFSQFTIMLDIIEDYLKARGYNYRRLDGSTNRIKRMIDMAQFNKPDSDIFIYILATRAGGLGVNLQTADTCILFDSDWNPQWDLQAMARVHRIGQTKPVHAYRLVSEGTVEDRIQRRAEAKLYLDQMVNRGSTNNAEQLESLKTSELLSMLRFGADRIFRNEAGQMPSEPELDRIIDRSHMMDEREPRAEAGPGGQRPEAGEPPSSRGGPSAEPTTAGQVPGLCGAGAVAGGLTCADMASRPEPSGGSFMSAKSHHTHDGVDGTEGGGERNAASGAAGGAGRGTDSADSAGTAAAGEAGAGEPPGGSGGAVAAGGEGAGGGAPGGSGDAGGLIERKHSALEFDAQAPAVDTFTFQGLDYRAVRETEAANLRDIAAQYWEQVGRNKRNRRERLINIGGFNVLRDNNYTMEEGMLHSPGQKRGQAEASKKTGQRAGIDYTHTDHCMVCWDGGDLVCCDFCPASYHPACVGLSERHVRSLRKWGCPQHACHTCKRSTSQAGGLLFRCEICSKAFCEDHLPEDNEMVGECELFKALGQRHPLQACFIQCGKDCKDFVTNNHALVQRLLQEARRTCDPHHHGSDLPAGAAAAAAAPGARLHATDQAAAGPSQVAGDSDSDSDSKDYISISSGGTERARPSDPGEQGTGRGGRTRGRGRGRGRSPARERGTGRRSPVGREPVVKSPGRPRGRGRGPGRGRGRGSGQAVAARGGRGQRKRSP